MKAIAVEIARWVDDSAYPPVVECLLVDASARDAEFAKEQTFMTVRICENGDAKRAG